ncbi:hypothetical protein C1I95_24715 [Micromonospora craterilacus]|uniref:Uncharacterized protein n=1 Tax=Micromonospora craterilacus TaxID=1655439 RepID=A0A2W2E8D1_9ACTN|nr:hypothetical protein [Micromonospora craterilacus]PZG12949.1 hypothetical protein C1I95_24715 [Micromonospora craterilacus]
MAEQIALLGEQGRRREHVEWGIRHPAMPGVCRAGVAPAADREHAEEMAAYGGPGHNAVCRTVVTYTTDWRTPTNTTLETP